MLSLRFSSYGFDELKVRILENIKYRIENQPYLDTYFKFDQLIFNNMLYSHPVIGTEEGIKRITIEDIKNCYYTYYAPNNAILVIVGDFDKEKTIYWIKRYFESIPKRKVEAKSFPPVIPKNEIVKIYKSAFIPLPVIHLGYLISQYIPSDYYILKLIEYLFLRGNSS
ncbi:insulinase family protein, partial [Candidatus Aminicenantes bacterium AC-335-L06]|nr:insulinase family protein [Candidatus Aminicenantes bacterium AC-335-L06]